MMESLVYERENVIMESLIPQGLVNHGKPKPREPKNHGKSEPRERLNHGEPSPLNGAGKSLKA